MQQRMERHHATTSGAHTKPPILLQMYNKKHKTLSALPTSAADMVVNRERAETTILKPFLYVSVDDYANGRIW